MLTVNTNTTSLITQLNLSRSNSLVKTSIERLSTGFKINRASDDAANMSISKNMSCQISGTKVAEDNAQQAVNLLQTADGALDNMQQNLLRMRDLCVQAQNGTYSNAEREMIQGEITNLLSEIYKQRNNTMFNQIRIFGDIEEMPIASTVALDGGSGATESVNLNNAVSQTGGTHPITPLTEEEAIAQGYTCIHNETEFANMLDEDGNILNKYCLMADIDFSNVPKWDNVEIYGELNGNGYSINNLTINSTTNSGMYGLFRYNYGTIKNLNMNNVSIDKNDYNIGGLVSENYGGIIENCSVSGSIKGGSNTGGLVGYSNGTITDCSSSATVTGNDDTGGLVGGNYNGTITDCSSSATVTGNNQTGGLVGYNNGEYGGGTITSCSSSGTVTGKDCTGGLVGYNVYDASINKSYSTGDVSGNNYVGGLAGYNVYANISNSYSLGNVSGNNFVGGFIGENNSYGDISKSYSTGNVEGTGNNVGGFVGVNGYKDEWVEETGYINNSYTTSELDFYGVNQAGEITNSHGRTAQTGVTAHDESWFEDGDNLSFLGDKFDTSTIPPQIIGNERPIPPDPPTPPTPTSTEVVFQIGANSGEENTLTIDTGFSLNNLTADVRTREAADKTLVDIDGALDNISAFRSTIGAMQNRLESVSQSLATRKNNMESSHSTIMDTDFALETSKLVQTQILQNVAASLLAQANTNPQIALTLLK